MHIAIVVSSEKMSNAMPTESMHLDKLMLSNQTTLKTEYTRKEEGNFN